MSGRSCSVPGCEGAHIARGWCTLHYQRWQRSGHAGGCEQRQTRYTPGQICTIAGCPTPVLARGWCSKHYQRWLKRGDVAWQPPTPEERFWAKVERAGADDCWEWVACRLPSGYGQVRSSSSDLLAHRLAWTLTYGEIPPGLFVMHRCDNPPCCNPDHLQLGTHKENMEDMARKGRGKKAGLPGSRNGRAKLDAEQVKEIRDLRGAETGKALAARFGISRTQVSKIQRGEQWTAV